ncbi:hypothetical protein GIB67_021438 [Kingdonia uniflora]|uniref:Uncharacterized protein n=1 Tax=Kingdonia uniflora TaxID=39325 RepID=A0A7J7NQG8_9MAGN|nr:hypothetical protein GIB67_021438 [Kingdonia uniflora]
MSISIHQVEDEYVLPQAAKRKPEDWVRFVDLTSTGEVKASRERNKINRPKMLTPHTTGRMGVFRVVDEMMEVDPTITRSDSFLIGHTRSDGTFPTTFVKEKVSNEKTKKLCNRIRTIIKSNRIGVQSFPENYI